MLFNEPVGFKNNCGVRAALEDITYYPYHVHQDILETVCVLDGKYHIFNGVHELMLSSGDVYFSIQGTVTSLSGSAIAASFSRSKSI